MEVILLFVWCSWVFLAIVRETLLRWHGLVVGKRRNKGFVELLFYVSFGQFGKRSYSLFGHKEQSVHFLKSIFFTYLFLWVKLYIGEGTMPLIDFIDWLGFD